MARAVCGAPRRACRQVRGTARAFARHLSDNARDYAFLYELLSLTLPLLLILYDVLLQMQTEAVPSGSGSWVLWV